MYTSMILIETNRKEYNTVQYISYSMTKLKVWGAKNELTKLNLKKKIMMENQPESIE